MRAGSGLDERTSKWLSRLLPKVETHELARVLGDSDDDPQTVHDLAVLLECTVQPTVATIQAAMVDMFELHARGPRGVGFILPEVAVLRRMALSLKDMCSTPSTSYTGSDPQGSGTSAVCSS
jgi:hypothetical protein